MVIGRAMARAAPSDTGKSLWPTFGFQQTYVSQWRPGFSAQYSGKNSLSTQSERQATLTATLFIEKALGPWVFRLHPEISGGTGLSQTTGIAAFPNGEAFRVGTVAPTLYLARMMAQYTQNGWALAIGKYSLTDYLQKSSLCGDARRQFLNWALMAPGAWDYAANTRGYTGAIVLSKDWQRHQWLASFAQVPTVANGPMLDWAITRKWQANFQYSLTSADTTADGQTKATLRIGVFYTQAALGNYSQAILTGTPVDIASTRDNNQLRNKYGVYLYGEQYFTNHWAGFARLSINDGQNETWAFTEIDHSLALGAQYLPRKRKWLQAFGSALAVSGISQAHRNYLASGQYGFIIGDGRLKYSMESIWETYLRCQFFSPHFLLSPSFQYVANPAFNRDRRGPIPILSIRGHIEW